MAEIRTNYYIVSSIFLAFSVALVFAHWVGTTSDRFEMSDFSLYLYLSTLLLVSNTAMLRYMLQRGCQQRVWQTYSARRHCDRNNKSIVSGVAKGGLIVFMIGTVLYDSIWLVGTFDCFGVFLSVRCQIKEQVITLTYLMLKLFFLGEQAMFLLSESDLYAKHGRSNTSRNVYVINSVVNFTIIVYTILYESRLVIQPESLINEGVFCSTELFQNATFHDLHHVTSCMNSTTDIIRIANGLEVYMYTYHSEFCILATSLNLMLWNASSRNVDGGDLIQVECTPGSSVNLDVRPTSWRKTSPRKEPENDKETSDLLTPSSEVDELELEEETFFTAQFSRSLNVERARDLRAKRITTGGYGAMSDGSTPVSSDDNASENLMTGSTRPSSSSSMLKNWFAYFKECSNCQGCLDPYPEHVYGSDDGCGFLAFVGFAVIIVYSVLALLQHNNKDGSHLDTSLLVFTVFVYVAMTAASILIAIVTTRKLNRGRSVPRAFSVGSIIIMLSALLMQIFNFLCLIAAFYLLLHREYNHQKHMHVTKFDIIRCATDIMEVCLDCVNIAMQTKIVLNINWIMKRNKFGDVRSSSTTMQCIAFLMVGNFSKWILGTIIEIQDPGVNSSQSIYFGKEAWTAVVYTFYPFVVYFRFHCSMAFAEYMLWRREMKNSGRQHPFLPSIGTFTYF